ncbi:GNAT family N-acetyltransferase [Micromonospora sp. NBC_00898]|uniref:GNAT family N-acetyltransferase n=1 Tax=Micromonospora sp. NBC_00898 TaxID=2975981 RepID=UPI00386BDA17
MPYRHGDAETRTDDQRAVPAVSRARRGGVRAERRRFGRAAAAGGSGEGAGGLRATPAGRAGDEGHRLWTVYDGDDEVRMLWLHLEQKSDGPHAFGYDFEVREELRRKGYGRAIMQTAEQVCRELGVVSVGLSVFGFNLGARALYEQMGYEVAAIKMRKRLQP